MRRDANNQADDELLLTGRLVPAGRDGNKVFARTLRPGEEDPGHGVTLQAGDQLIIRAGGLVIHSEEIDAQSVAGRGGYAPVANTVWTWYHIVGGVQLSFFLFLFSLARRIDAAHALWALAIHERDKAREEGGIPRRIGFFNALATAEVAIVAIHRGITMVHTLAEKFLPELQVPESVEQVRTAVKEMRDAFEHIDERSEGRSGMSQKGRRGCPDHFQSAGLHRVSDRSPPSVTSRLCSITKSMSLTSMKTSDPLYWAAERPSCAQ